jgi:hypothetical protein
MGNMIAVDKWLGLRGEPMNPEQLQFTTQEGKSCRLCAFDGQRHSVCVRAGKAALRAGLQDCGDAAVIYVLREVDIRQLTIEVK